MYKVQERWYSFCMRFSFSSLLSVLISLSFATNAGAQTIVFTVNLGAGSRGTQVVALQQALNRDPDTRITTVGPGSPGNETDYFGMLTKIAVVKFQEKYVNEVLAPGGLIQGNGYVGTYTRAKLNSLSASVASSGSVNLLVVPPVVTPTVATTPVPVIVSPTTTPVLGITSQNPNLKNIEKFIATIDKVSAKQGLSDSAIAVIKEQIMKEVATTTDLHAAFLKQIQYASHQSINNDSFAGRVLAMVEQLFVKTFMPEHARAATGIPFGGALIFPFYCTQSQTWLITITPLPPSYAVLLSYVPFTQAFLSYNIPMTSWLLGEYMPGAGVCVAGICPYCTTIPNEGMISPMTGSSPV